jgi:DNA-binding transcriptional ArsR family regulator
LPLNVHIALVGKTEEPILNGVYAYGAVDKLYLLHSDLTKSTATKIKKILKSSLAREIILRDIDAFSMNSIVNRIIEVARSESYNNRFINITGGTNLMAGAACAASFFTGSQAYYILNPNDLPKGTPRIDQLVKIPIPKVPLFNAIEGMKIRILQFLTTKIDCTSSKLIRKEMEEVSPQLISYHLKELEKMELITLSINKDDSRTKIVCLSEAGKLMALWLKNR